MIWQEDLERIALLHFKYEMFVLLEDDFGMPGQALKTCKGPSGETTKEKEINLVAVRCNARSCPSRMGAQGAVGGGGRGNALARGRLGRARADWSRQCRASAHPKHHREEPWWESHTTKIR